MGIGGSVLFSTLRGKSKDNYKKSNEVFTASLIGCIVLGIVSWFAMIVRDLQQPLVQ